LVAQDEDLDVLGGVGSGAQHHPAQELGEHEVDQLYATPQIMPAAGWRLSSWSRAVCIVSGTHRAGMNTPPRCHGFEVSQRASDGCGLRGHTPRSSTATWS
jgi:hypothetical protein